MRAYYSFKMKIFRAGITFLGIGNIGIIVGVVIMDITSKVTDPMVVYTAAVLGIVGAITSDRWLP